MKFTIGFAAGVAAAWAALAIWQRIPEFPDLDASEVPDVEPWLNDPLDEDAFERRWRGDCTGFRGAR